MPHMHELKTQNYEVDTIALGTLAARTAINLNAGALSIGQSFLTRRIRYLLKATGMTVSDDGPIAICCGSGNSSLAEVAAAFTTINTIGPGDKTQSLLDDNVWNIWQASVVIVEASGIGTEGTITSDWITLPGKGLVAQENHGMSIHAVNLGSGALTTGQLINGIVQTQGVWLRD